MISVISPMSSPMIDILVEVTAGLVIVTVVEITDIIVVVSVTVVVALDPEDGPEIVVVV